MRLKRSLALVLSVLLVLGAVTPVAFAADDTIDRIKGADRWETAVAVSQEGWDSSDIVVLANGDNFADALAGVPLAHQLDAPLLLTRAASLPDVIAEEIERLDATEVIVLGGTAAVSAAVVEEIEDMGIEVERISGADRYATAAAVAAHDVFDGVDTVFIAYGRNFPDALAAASYAAQLGFPILLTEKNSIPEATATFIEDIENIFVIGGTGVIGDIFEGADRISGANRYLTALELAKEFAPDVAMFYIATGEHFADALAGAVLAAQQGTGLLLVGSSLNADVAAFLTANVTEVIAFGGTAAVSAAVGNAIMEAVTPLEEAYLADLEAMTSNISATNDEDGVVRTGTEIYFNGIDQYGKDFTITSVNDVDVEFSIDGMPLTLGVAADYTFTAEDGLAKIYTEEILREGAQLSISFENEDDGLEASFSFRVGAAALGSVTKVEVSADETTINALETVTFTVEGWNQWNNPEAVTDSDFRWVIRQDGEIVYNEEGLDPMTYTFNEAGVYTVQVYLIDNTSVRDLVTITVKPADLTTLTYTADDPAPDMYNNEENVIGKLVQNDGALLTADMIKFNVEVGAGEDYTASDVQVWAKVRGGTAGNKDDIVIVVKSAEIGSYSITPYVGAAYDHDDAVLSDTLDVTTVLNETVTSITIEAFKTNELAEGQSVEKEIKFFNKHGEEVAVAAGSLTIVSTTGITATEVTEDGDIVGISFAAAPDSAGARTVNIVYGAVSKSVTVTVVDAAEVESIKLGKSVVVIEDDAHDYDDERDDIFVYETPDPDKTYVVMPVEFFNQYGFKMAVTFEDTDCTWDNTKLDIIPLKLVDDEYALATEVTDVVAALGVHAVSKPATSPQFTFTVNEIDALVTVTVKEARKATTFEIDDFDLSIMLGVDVLVELEDITVYDQYGVEFSGSETFVVTDQAGNTTIDVDDGTEGQWTLNGAAAGSETITFKMMDDTTTVKTISYKMTVSTEDQITSIVFEEIGTLNFNADDTRYSDTNRYDQVTAVVKVYAGTLEVAYDNTDLTWFTTHASVATVSNAGLIAALDVEEGSTTITAMSSNGTLATIVVDVVNDALVPSSVKFADVSTSNTVPTEIDGDVIELGEHVAVYDQNGVQVNLAGAGWEAEDGSDLFTVTFTSLNTAVATVDSDGTVTGKAEGTATIRVTVTYDGSYVGYADLQVTVKTVTPI